MPKSKRPSLRPAGRAVPPGHVKMTEAPTVYANLCNIQITSEEVIFVFGQRSLDNPALGNGAIAVYTSLSHAKRIARVLQESIARYETVFGEIADDPAAKLSPEVLERLISEGKIL